MCVFANDVANVKNFVLVTSVVQHTTFSLVALPVYVCGMYESFPLWNISHFMIIMYSYKSVCIMHSYT